MRSNSPVHPVPSCSLLFFVSHNGTQVRYLFAAVYVAGKRYTINYITTANKYSYTTYTVYKMYTHYDVPSCSEHKFILNPLTDTK